MNNPLTTELRRIVGKPHFNRGIALAKKQIVKKFITYRAITVAIGILVALVIVLTLWVTKPGDTVSGSEGKAPVGASVTAKNLFKTAVAVFKF